MSKVILDITFPAELQLLSANAQPPKEDDVKLDVLHLRVSMIGNDIYDLALWADSDVFFHLVSKIDRNVFDVLRREQQLVVGFEAFPASLGKLLQGCVTERVTQAALLLIEGDIANLHIV